MRSPWSKKLFANTAEIKLATIIAIFASIAVLFSTLWFTLGADEELVAPKPLPSPVNIVEKPQATPTATNDANTQAKDIYTSATLPKHATSPPKPEPAAATEVVHKPKPIAKRKTLRIGKGKLYIQVGAYQKHALADLMFQKMLVQHKRAKVVKKGSMHAVWVGPVSTKEEALTLKKRIIRLNHITGFIVKENP